MTDLDFIQIALELAAQGAARVSPNPLVGAVVVKDGLIVGQGYHRYDELKHAEVWALEQAGPQARGATVYVNLEPCAYQGAGKRTPPCVQALLDANVRRVVASMLDPNPRVNGNGFAQLRAAGIEVEVGLMETQAQRLNEKYVKHVTTQMPFVHLKMACSLDGRIATRTGESQWITGEEARAASQSLRHEYDAILTGIGTVLKDDPLLTDRTHQQRRRPLLRVILDASLRTPLASRLVQTANDLPLLVFTAQDASAARREALEALGASVVCVDSQAGQLDLTAVLEELGRRQITGLIVEGGAEVAGAFVERQLIDKVTFFIAPKIIGGREAKSAIGGQGIEYLRDALHLRDVDIIRRGDDLEVTGYPVRNRER